MTTIEERIREALSEHGPEGASPSAVQKLSPEVRDLCAVLSEQLSVLVAEVTTTAEGDHLAAPHLLSALLRRRFESGGLQRGWWGMFRLDSMTEAAVFGRSILKDDSYIRFRKDTDDWLLAPAESAPLSSPMSKIVLQTQGENLRVGFDFPEHPQSIKVEENLIEGFVRVYALHSPPDQLWLDRLRASAWAPYGGNTEMRPVNIQAGLALDPLLISAETSRINHESIYLPLRIFNNLNRKELPGTKPMYWFSIKSPGWKPDIVEQFELKLNCVAYTNRLSSLLGKEGPYWLDKSQKTKLALPFSKDIGRPQGIVICGITTLSGREYHEVSELSGPDPWAYSAVRAQEGDQALALINFEAAPSDELQISVVYYPLSTRPRGLMGG
jgi:hypothetical protein